MPHSTEVELRQDYKKYTPEDFQVWSTLFKRQSKVLENRVASVFKDGLEALQFTHDRIPEFDEFNKTLDSLTGWKATVVPGLLDNKPFFEMLLNRGFPASTWLRKKSQMDYLEEPDMFHDVYGHVPLLSNRTYCAYLYGLSKIALQYIENPIAIEIITRVHWYTIEFGLIREQDGAMKIYGAGLVSSSGEAVYCLENDIPSQRINFDLEMMMDTPFIKDKYQQRYFVIDDCLQLFECLPDLELGILRRLEHPERIQLSA